MLYKRIAVREDIYKELVSFQLWLAAQEKIRISISDTIGWLLLNNMSYVSFKKYVDTEKL
jgi:hypothetical protein